MDRLDEIEERLNAPSLAYDMSFNNGQHAEGEFYKHATSDIYWLIKQVRELREENATLRKYLHDELPDGA